MMVSRDMHGAMKNTHIGFEIRVGKRLLYCYTLLGIKGLHHVHFHEPRQSTDSAVKVLTKLFVKKSTARGLALGNSWAKGFRFRNGSARM